MLIEKKQFSKRNKIMVSILAVLFVVTAYYLYIYLVPPTVGPVGDLGPTNNLPTKLDTRIFIDSRFSQLLLRGSFPITIDRVGNRQPIHF